MDTRDCLADDLIVAFRDGGLDSDKRRMVVEHLADCTSCRDLFLNRPHAAKRTAIRATARRGIVLALAVVTVGAGTFALLQNRLRPNRGIEAIARASNALPHRPIEGRLSAGFAYRPLEPAYRGESQADAKRLKLRAAAANVRSDHPGSYAAGIAALLDRDYDRAIRAVEEASQRMPDDPLVLSDLSAAYHARAMARNHAPDHTAALDAAERSWRMRRTPEGGWNRAVAITALSLVEPARQAWDDVLAIDSDPGWRREAQERRADLQAPSELEQWRRQQSGWTSDSAQSVVERFPAPAHAFVDDDLLPRWAAARLRREATVQGDYDLALAIAHGLARQGERLPLDTLLAIDEACRTAAGCDAIARAHATYAAGVELLDAQKIAGAAAAFDEATAAFERLQSPYALLSRFRRGACMLHANEFARAASDGKSLLAAVAGRPYRDLSARASWLLGLAILHQARPEESVSHYRDALEGFTRARDVVNVASAEFLLADGFEYAGQRNLAMQHRMAGLKALRRGGDAKLLANALFDFAVSASEESPFAADFLLAESARVAVRGRRFVIAALSSMWRSALAARRSDFAAAGDHARMASRYSQEMTDTGQQALIAAHGAQLSAASHERKDAAAKLTQAIDFFRRAGHHAWLPELLRQRALVLERDGDRAGAERDFAAAIEAAERTLDVAAPATMRDGFASNSRKNFEDLIRLLVGRGEIHRPLAVAERARLIGTGVHDDDEVLAVIRSMDRATAAAVLEVQPNALFVWLVRHDAVTFYRSDLPAKELDALTRDVASADARAALYDMLVRKWIADIPPGTRLVVLPSPPLSAVPFGALIERRSGRAVIDDHAVVLAGSLASMRAKPVTVTRSDQVLIVGDPSYRNLPRLPASRSEANAIAGHYERPVVLLGTEATARNIVARADEVEVFHFGGHAVVNELAPELSSIMLAADGDDDTRLYIHELLQRRFASKLVVVSACSTAKSSAGGLRGTLTIAKAFLEGGSRAVVATHWPVPDIAAALFSQTFHKALSEGEDVPSATRTAQLHLRSARPLDPTWAAFSVLQGAANQKE